MSETSEVQLEPIEDARSPVRFHFLDVGGQKYGECILIEADHTRVLIDGGHRTDFAGQRGYDSIPKQLQELLGPAPIELTLLVVTHGHDDHIGSLLDLVRHDVVRPSFALVVDPALGFGRPSADDAADLDPNNPTVALAAVLREEDASDLSDDELAEFIDGVAGVESRYAEALSLLRQKGTQVIPYRGQSLPEDLLRAVEPTGLTLLGPSEAQLLYCAEQIATTNKEAQDAIDGLGREADATDLVGIYRDLVGRSLESDVSNPRGNGMNCQSLTFAFGTPGARALIAGDMQFVEPGVEGADDEVKALRDRVIEAGPYSLYKTTHHTSHNGQDRAFLDRLGSPALIVHSGGVRDAGHPYPGVLSMLKARGGIQFARTDRNGLISVDPHLPPAEAIKIRRGRLNDFTPNRPADLEPLAASVMEPSPLQRGERAINVAAGAQIVIVNLPPGPIDLTVAGVDIRVRRQSEAVRGGLVPDEAALRPRPRSRLLQIDRDLSHLLFVTNPARLRSNIGEAEADAVLSAVSDVGASIVTGAGEALPGLAVQALRRAAHTKGVVILGGYDVAPSIRTDVLGGELRDSLGARVATDADRFWVWSDRLYADVDGDHLAEFPISRVPDARDAKLMFAALSAEPFQNGERFGVRNVARPFADTVWQEAPGARPLEVSETFTHDQVVTDQLGASCHYFMLHGSDSDGRAFQGEYTAGTGYPTAFTVRNVPDRFDGVVFTGCCWGALIAEDKAADTPSATPAPRPHEASIALSYLRAGAIAFVGCTGSHYSGPDPNPDANYAARLHEAFFQRLAAPEASPAQALHEARELYLAFTVGGPARQPLELARRLKNAHQFTCLGLGW